ncbi:MAG: type II toxin-antitoxin system Phd/YefM family antitoxin [Thermoleophilia bacterium]
MSTRSRIGVRELREHLSATLRRVRSGEVVEVTERGVPIARLTPMPGAVDPIARLIAEGVLDPAEDPHAPLVPGLTPAPGAPPSQEIIEGMRADVDDGR